MQGQSIRLVGQSQRDFAKRLIDVAPMMAVVNIREATRTGDQNAKLWAMLSDVSRAKPQGRLHTSDQWKAIFMHSCGHKAVFIEDLDNESFLCLGFKSSKLTKAQMSELIECIYEYGARHGVPWSEPHERKAA